MYVSRPSFLTGVHLFFCVFADSDACGAMSWVPIAAGAARPVNFRTLPADALPDPSGSGVLEVLAGGHHGWSFGLWKSAALFDEKQLQIGSVSDNFVPLLAIPAPASFGPIVFDCNPISPNPF